MSYGIGAGTAYFATLNSDGEVVVKIPIEDAKINFAPPETESDVVFKILDLKVPPITFTFRQSNTEVLNTMRVFGWRRYHFAKYHVLTYGCRRKAQS